MLVTPASADVTVSKDVEQLQSAPEAICYDTQHLSVISIRLYQMASSICCMCSLRTHEPEYTVMPAAAAVPAAAAAAAAAAVAANI